MKILVAVKRVADPDNLNKIKLSAQGKVDTTGLEPKASPYDEYALETALRLTENGANTKAAPRRGRRSSPSGPRRPSRCSGRCSARAPIGPSASTRPTTRSTATSSPAA